MDRSSEGHGKLLRERPSKPKTRRSGPPRKDDGLLKEYLEKAPDGVYVIDMDGVFLYCNERSEVITGRARNELLGNNLFTAGIVAPESREKVLSFWETIAAGGRAASEEIGIIHRLGHTVPTEISASVITHRGRNAVLWFLRDITNRRRARDSLFESEKKYHMLFDSANDAIFLMKDYLFVNCNLKTLAMFACRKEDIVGQSPIAFSPEFQPDGMASYRKGTDMMNLAINGSPQSFDWVHCRKDGTPFDTEVSLNSIELGGEIYLQAIVRDVTEKKRAREEIVRERQRLQTLSDNVPFGVVLINKKGRFIYVNARFTELFGYTIADVPDGRTWFQKAYPDVEYREKIITTWMQDFRDAKPGYRIPRAFSLACKDGTKKTVELTTSILESGEFLITCEDITEMRRLEARLHQAQKMESIGTLAGGIAHDFNNILTALMGYATLVQIKTDVSSPVRSYVDAILTASEKAADLTRSLLAFSRQQPVSLHPLDINMTISTTRKLLRRLLTEDIDLRTSLTEQSAVALADKSQMDQILFNLITNARDAMAKGGSVVISTDVVEMDETFIKANGFGREGRYVLISVSDTGIGMDAATREKIFDPFFTTKETGKGTGLGLATIWGIVNQHNGYIGVYSEPGRGTTFRIYLPAASSREDREPATPVERVAGNETILVAEDSEDVRRFIKEALREYGYSVIEAVDGVDAIEQFRSHRETRLVILDSVMPGKNGREAYSAIREIDPDIRVLFISGHTKDIVLDKGIEEGKFAFIGKPLSFDQLLAKVHEVLSS